MLTDTWTPMRYHAKQSRAWRAKERFVLIAAGRGSGKTELARRRIVRWLPVKKPWARPMYFYALPTRPQAKRVAWQAIKALVPKHWLACDPLDGEMVIKTIFGSELYVVGMDRPQRIEGDQWDGGVIDESCDQRPGAFGRSIVPALSHRNGWCWRIGVPKRFGIGAVEFKEACMNAKDDSIYLTWPSSDILTPDQIRWAQENLDARDFREQYMASWETAAGLIFHAFDEVLNVTATVEYDPNRPIIVGSDFNVDPMCWCLNQLRNDGKELHTFDEMFVRNANTPLMLDRLHERFKNHRAGFEFYGDASGRARKTSASFSDYALIRNDLRFHRRSVHYPPSNPLIRNRFAACNSLLCNVLGARRAFIHPRCKRLISDLRDRAYLEDTGDPNDQGDLGHMSDAWGYVVHALFRIALQYDPSTKSSVGISVGV